VGMSWKRVVAAFAIASLYGPAGSLPAWARGGPLHLEGPWHSAHVEGLPQEVRASVERSSRACGAPITAQHLFSRYIQDGLTGDQFIAIHFDEMDCVNRAAVCTAAGCLHQVYVSKGGAYKLILNTYVPDLTQAFRRNV
jgi:hypothetical protein